MNRSGRRNRSPVSRAVEALDARRLLAASLNGGLLTITGTSRADVVTVAPFGDRLNVVQNGAIATFTTANVTSITAGLGNGDDSIKLASTLNLPATLSGEAGNDTLVGGAANDALYGGSGNDIAQGNAGNDNIELSTGDDTLDGGTGNDTLDGGDGTDEVTYASRPTPITGSLLASLTATPDDPVPPPFMVALTGTVTAAGGESDGLKNVETLTGGGGDDTLSSNATSQFWDSGVVGTRPTVRINGGGGDDVLTVSTGYAGSSALSTVPMIADGGVGNDALSGSDFVGVQFIGGEGNDTISFGNDDSAIPSVDAGPGFDTVSVNLPVGVSSYTVPLGVEKISVGSTQGHLQVYGNAEDNIITVGGGETVFGAGGNDLITTFGDSEVHGDSGNDTLISNDGNDTLDGGSGDDSLVGGAGDDSLYGSADDDTLDGGAGNDTLNGGSGKDTATYASRSVPITGSLTTGVSQTFDQEGQHWVYALQVDGAVTVGSEQDVLHDDETLQGGGGDDTLTATAGDATYGYISSPMAVRLDAEGGNDSLFTFGLYNKTSPNLIADGGDGNDHFQSGDSSSYRLIGGKGNDTFANGDDDSDASIDAGPGFDTYNYRNDPGINYTMPSGLEAINAAGGSVTIVGNELDNVIVAAGRVGNVVSGGAGDDKITILNSSGRANGDNGDDTLIGSEGSDSLRGGDGNDDLAGGGGSDTLRGDAGDDRLAGNGGSDRLYGGDGRDRLSGSGGNDILDGGAGIDSIYGGDGRDRATRDRKDRIVKEIETFI